MLQTMVELVSKFPLGQWVVAGVDSLDKSLYAPAENAGIKVVFNQTYDLLSHATVAVVTSGTATLETVLFRVPQVVVYRTSPISYHIGKRVIRVPFISLVNLIAGKEVVREFIQDDFSPAQIEKELNAIFTNPVHKGEILQGYDEILEKLGDQSASETVAKRIIESLK